MALHSEITRNHEIFTAYTVGAQRKNVMRRKNRNWSSLSVQGSTRDKEAESFQLPPSSWSGEDLELHRKTRKPSWRRTQSSSCHVHPTSSRTVDGFWNLHPFKNIQPSLAAAVGRRTCQTSELLVQKRRLNSKNRCWFLKQDAPETDVKMENDWQTAETWTLGSSFFVSRLSATEASDVSTNTPEETVLSFSVQGSNWQTTVTVTCCSQAF